MLSELESFYEKQEEPVRGCLLALRSIILDFDPKITESWKWRLPFFCIPKKSFCYLWIDKKTKHPYIGIVKGGLIDHPALVQGDRKVMKVLPIDPNEDIPIEMIVEILEMAKSFY